MTDRACQDGQSPRRSPMRLVIAGGGTGGHVFPGVAVAEALGVHGPVEVLWIGTGRPVEGKAMAGRGWNHRVLPVRPLQGKGLLARGLALAGLPQAIIRACIWLRAFRPHVVFGVGGYVSGPVVVAAALLRVPSALHEQNVVPGLANRLAARFVSRVFVSCPRSAAYFPPPERVAVTGNPVRHAIIARKGGRGGASGPDQTVLILGGSQGASGLNRLAADAVALLWRSGVDFRVIHQTGERDRASVEEAYREAGGRSEVAAFIDDMGAAYLKADLVLCRAGATTVAELTAMGLPAVLVPYPYAASGHQEANALEMVRSGAAVLVREHETDAGALAAHLGPLVKDRARLVEMGRKALALGRPEAAEEIARLLVGMADGRSRGRACPEGAQRGWTARSYV